MDSGKQFLLLMYRNQNKKVLVQQMTVPNILSIVKERFGVSDPALQYLDNDVDDWVDLEQESEEFIRDLRVVKIRIAQGKESTNDENSSANSRPSTPERPPTPINNPQTAPSTPSTPASRPTSTTRPSTPAGTHNAVHRPQTPVNRPPTPAERPPTPVDIPVTPTISQRQAVKISDKAWPRLYKIPKENIARGVVDKIERKEKLTTGERRNLLEAIYNDVTKYAGGMYPTSEMYEDIVDSLIREFPQLLSFGGLPSASARAYWKDKIVFKFGNARKGLDKTHPDVIKKKKSRTQNEVEESTVKTFVWGLGKYLPEPLRSEDERSIDLHILSLKREYRKSNADVNIEVVNTKMNLTFPHRRHLIVNEKKGLPDIIETFPWLQSYQEILKEFERLQPNTSSQCLEELLTVGLQKYRKAIVSLLKSKKKNDFLTEVETTSSYYRTEGQKNSADDVLAMAGLPLLFKEKVEKLLLFKEDNNMPIYILINDKLLTMEEKAFSVYVEGVKLCDCDSFFQVYTVFIGSFYVFNLVYPKCWEKTLTFLQNVLLGLKDSQGQVNLDRRILNVLTAINEQLS